MTVTTGAKQQPEQPIENAIRWTPAHSVNVDSLDRQHQELIAIMAKLSSALAAREGKKVIGATFAALTAASKAHFSEEESLMAQHSFPDLAEHRRQHDVFRKQMSSFEKEHAAGRQGVPVLLMLFIQRWLKQHVMKMDKSLGTFLNARGLR